MQIVTSPPKKNISFYFSLAFGQRGSSWALVSIPVVVSFQALAWVLKDNNPEYVCAYCRKICTKLYWNYIWKQPIITHLWCCLPRWIWSWKCWRVERCSGHPWRTCVITCMKVFLMDTFENHYKTISSVAILY